MQFPWFHSRRQHEEELDAEIRIHLDEAIRDRIERGETPEQARADALREFGNVGLVKEVTREMWGWGTLERLGQDLRFGARRAVRIASVFPDSLLHPLRDRLVEVIRAGVANFPDERFSNGDNL